MKNMNLGDLVKFEKFGHKYEVCHITDKTFQHVKLRNPFSRKEYSIDENYIKALGRTDVSGNFLKWKTHEKFAFPKKNMSKFVWV